MWLVTLCLMLGAEDGAASSSSRPLTAISQDLNRLLKEEAKAKTWAERQGAVIHLTDLYREMMQHDLRSEHEFLKNMAAQLRSRLVRIGDDLERQLARDERRAPPAKDAASIAADEEQMALRHSLAVSLSLADQTLGSPALAFSQGGGTVTESNGRALVELIERTINPAFWDTNGGTGTVFYYAPLQCLVVTATGHIHEEIGGLLGAVRE